MGKLLKIFASGFCILILLIIIAAITLSYSVDPNDFKPEIASIVKDKSGRAITIDGDLKLSVFPWLGIATEKMTLSNAPGYTAEHFAQIKEGRIKIKLLPLLFKQIEVSKIVLNGLTLNLEKNDQGAGNWEDLGGTTQQDQALPLPALAAFAVGGLSIKDAQIIWDDRHANKHIEFNALNLETDRLEFDKPVGIEFSVTAITEQPRLIEQLSFTGELSVDKSLHQFDLRNMVLSSSTTGELVPSGKLPALLSADISYNSDQQHMQITGLQLSSGSLKINAELNAEHLSTQPRFHGSVNVSQFSPRQLMQQWQIELPPMKDVRALQQLGMQFNINATAESMSFNDIIVNLDDTRLHGSAAVNNFKQPQITFTFNADRIDFDRYLRPPSDVAANNKPPRSLGTPATAIAAAVSAIPMDTLKALNASGTLAIEQLTANNLHLRAIKLKLNTNNGMFDSQQSVQQLYHGNYSGNLHIEIKQQQPELTMYEQFERVQIEPLLTDLYGKAKMSGTVNASAKLKATGNTQAKIKSSLTGEMDLLFQNGVIKGFNLSKIINDAKAILKKTKPTSGSERNETPYTEISLHAQIKNGLVHNDDLFAKSSLLHLNGAGTLDLTSEQLNYKVTAKMIKQQATANEEIKFKSVPVIIDLGGTISDPVYTLNIKEMIPEEKKQKLLDKVDKKFGKDVSKFLKQFF